MLAEIPKGLQTEGHPVMSLQPDVKSIIFCLLQQEAESRGKFLRFLQFQAHKKTIKHSTKINTPNQTTTEALMSAIARLQTPATNSPGSQRRLSRLRDANWHQNCKVLEMDSGGGSCTTLGMSYCTPKKW